MLDDVWLSIVVLNAIMLSVVILTVVAPYHGGAITVRKVVCLNPKTNFKTTITPALKGSLCKCLNPAQSKAKIKERKKHLKKCLSLTPCLGVRIRKTSYDQSHDKAHLL